MSMGRNYSGMAQLMAQQYNQQQCHQLYQQLLGVQHGIGSATTSLYNNPYQSTHQPNSGTISTALHPGYFAIDSACSSTRKPLESAGIKVGEIIGWRMWQLKGDYLMSYSADRIYAPGEPMKGEPSDYNNEGIWAFKEKNRALQKMLKGIGPSVYGSVKMWGKIIEHELGYRSEFASVASIDDVFIAGSRKEKANLTKELRERYIKCQS